MAIVILMFTIQASCALENDNDFNLTQTTDVNTFNDKIVDDLLTNVILGGLLGGAGVGMILSSGASTGGTDIVCEIVSKYTRVSLGKAMWVSDGLVVLSGLFVSSWEVILYGFLVLYLFYSWYAWLLMW